MSSQPFFSIIIVSLNGGPVIARALNHVLASDYEDFEVIVVDNGSTDDLAQVVRTQFPRVRLIQSPVNLGFAGGNNLGLRAVQGDILVLLNDDTEVRPGWLSAWARVAARNPRWGILGCKLLYPDGQTVQHAGGIVHPNGLTDHIGHAQRDDGRFDQLLECSYVTGAAMAIRREVYEILGGLDEGYFPIYFEETDYCRQARRIGYDVLCVPDSVVIHHESRTQTAYSFRFLYRYTRCRIRFIAKCFSRGELLRAVRYELRWWSKRYGLGDRRCLPYLCGYASALTRMPWYLRDRLALRRRMTALSHAVGRGRESTR